MPATAGRVRMPANNRVHSSAALLTHEIWQNAIGYDPYAPNKEESKGTQEKASSSGPDAENAYASFQGLLALARVTNSSVDEARGFCKKCGRVGHLTFQCRNFLSIKDDKDKDPEAIEAAVLSGLDKLKGIRGKTNERDGGESSEESSEEESESSDSDYDSELERAIAKKYGKKAVSKLKSSGKTDDSDDDVSACEERNKRGRSRKRRSAKRADTDSEDDGGKRRRRKEKRRRKDESSEDEDERRQRKRESRREKQRRRSHRHSKDSDASEDSGRERKRENRRAAVASDGSGSEDSRVGRDRKKYSGKKSTKHRYDRED